MTCQIFYINLNIKRFYMSLLPVNCPYCGAQNSMQIISSSTTDKLTTKFISHEKTNNTKIPKHDIKCNLCLNEYELIKIDDYSYVKSKLMPLSTMLTTFKTHFPNHDLNSLFRNIVGLTRPKKSFSDKVLRKKPHLHICFELDGKRAFIDCEQVIKSGKVNKTILRGLDIGI